MSRPTAMAALTATLATLAAEQDAVSVLNNLVRACADTLQADVGVLVAEDFAEPTVDRFDLLAASSHTAGSLELYQAQIDEGACKDSMLEDDDLSVVGDAALVARWPRFGPSVLRSDRHAVHALPMRWRGRPFGALNIFLDSAHPLTADERTAARAFADLAAITTVHAGDRIDMEAVARAVRTTAEQRALVEQAKGVVRYLRGVDAGDAFVILERRAYATSGAITAVAQEVLDAAERGDRPAWLTGD
ncbi:ANTAR domain-containing protein [Cellulomonas endometrii]|uniref:ANTAR domain-containing protein n=1 Tax=Cellulomonas endometrii TaxID=3036301 RepID=UPI0024AD5D77|nr:ANTAR domain-containing protein [Cellulomonas endometrii]